MRQARAQGKAAFPTLGTIERLDPRFDRLVPQRRPGRADRRGVRLVRGARLGPGRRICSSPTCRAIPSSSGRRARASASSSSRAATRARPARRRAGLQRPADGSPGPAGPLPARRPPRRPARGRQVHDAGRPLHGQAVQQPQRRRLQVQRRPVFHRPAVRPPGAERGPGQGARLQRRLPDLRRRRHGRPC